MSRDVATWVPRHRQQTLRDMGKPCRAMSVAICRKSFGDTALAQNHIARCRWRCVGLALATSPWLRITSRDVAGDVWRSSLRSPLGPGPGPWALALGPGTRAPFFLNKQGGVCVLAWACLLARACLLEGASLVIGCVYGQVVAELASLAASVS